ncbi:unnamed protein product [Brassica rapa]|uniref:Cation/H+ exchanger domain-containing protein n=2 Tax=Brassica campestris TaxID=3711 RepID=A0A8D9M4B1_BRACM|nr:unnamed protein product [Brassica rapa]
MKTSETKSPFRSPPIHSIDLFASHINSNLFYSFLTILSFGVIGVFISTTIILFGTWWLSPKLGFKGLTARDYLDGFESECFLFLIQPSEAYSHQLILFALYRFLIFEKSISVLRFLLLKLVCLQNFTISMLTLHILHQDETPLLYSLVLGEGVVNDATSVVHFNVVQKIHVESIYGLTALRVFENFLYLFSTSTILGIAI